MPLFKESQVETLYLLDLALRKLSIMQPHTHQQLRYPQERERERERERESTSIKISGIPWRERERERERGKRTHATRQFELHDTTRADYSHSTKACGGATPVWLPVTLLLKSAKMASKGFRMMTMARLKSLSLGLPCVFTAITLPLRTPSPKKPWAQSSGSPLWEYKDPV